MIILECISEGQITVYSLSHFSALAFYQMKMTYILNLVQTVFALSLKCTHVYE